MANCSRITHDGITDTLKGWSERTGIPASTIFARLKSPERWTVARALTTPPNRKLGRGGRRPKDAPRPCPPLKPHPATGQACCRWSEGGRDQWKYFGKWGTAGAKAAYRRFAAEWNTDGPPPPAGDSFVAEVVIRWRAHCDRTYRKRGRVTSEVHLCRAATRHLVELYGDTPAAEFDPKKLRAVRAQMAAEGWTRKTVNGHVARIVRMFAWAAVDGAAPKAVYDLLALVEPIAKGRDFPTADPEPKKPVPRADIDAVLPHLHPRPKRRAVYDAMIRVQLLTGMRPGELCSVRPADIDRTREPWRYEVTEYNKMLHREQTRVLFFGPEARALLSPLLTFAEPDRPVFMLPPWRKKAAWSPISVVRYRNVIRRACLAAGVPVWTPHRLRHNRATEVMDKYEDASAAGAAIGDSPEVLRQVYADRPGEAVAKRIAEATG